MKTKAAIWIMPLLVVSASLPAAAQGRYQTRGHWGEEQMIRFDIGEFRPDADSRYWDDIAIDFTGDRDDFEDATLGVEWVKFLGDRLGLSVAGSFYEGGADQSYREFVDERGFEIVHRTELEMSSFTIGLLVHLAQRDQAIVPYVGLGGGVWGWRLTEIGDFIDFSRDLEIFSDFFEDEGSALGYYWRLGLDIPIADNWTLYAEGRWQKVDDDLGRDFEGLGELDLSGRTIAAGLSVSF